MSDIAIVVAVFIVAVLVIGGIEQGLVALLSRSSEPVLTPQESHKQYRQVLVIPAILGWNVIAMIALTVYGEEAFYVTVGISFALYIGFKCWLWKYPEYERYFIKSSELDVENKE